ncbi:MAG: ribosomal protein L16, partial [Pirellulaceae bacterium]|nr:ribosomal protein L16 [Pirellulaceae bacterium]
MPKRVKHRKVQRGRIKGNASRGNTVVFGDFGLQAMQPGWLKAQTIEAGR